MNYLAIALPLAGRTTGEVSARYPVSVTPAGYAFSIWSLIYLALTAFVVYQLLPSRAFARIDRIRILFVLSCLFNVAWLFFWHNLYVTLSQLFMFGLLTVLVLIYRELRANATPSGAAGTWLLRVPFSLYLGWISVATFANLAAVLYDLGPLRADWLDLSWTLLALVALTVLTLWLLRLEGDVVYALVAVWAFVGILVANLGQPITVVAAGVATLLLLAAVAQNLRARPWSRQT